LPSYHPCPQVKIEAGGIADNVLPKTGSLKLNFRLLPGQDAAFVRDYLQMVTRKEADHVSMRQLGKVSGMGWAGQGTPSPAAAAAAAAAAPAAAALTPLRTALPRAAGCWLACINAGLAR
jgi:acetylornithine deacetylase/succinyl-diaminopimelate desuccinylase-like protein